MLLAVAVVGVVALRRFTRPVASLNEQRRRAVRLGLVGLGPAVVLFGWLYVRNMVLYGDVGASQYLLGMFRRQPQGSLFDQIVRWSMWSNVFDGLMSPTTRRRVVPPGSAVITLIAALGVGIVFVTGRISRGADAADTGVSDTGSASSFASRTDEAHTLRWQISLGLIAIGLIAVTIAQHVSGGGNAHARYAMPAIGVAAVLVVIGMERVWSRWAPLALVAIAGWWALLDLPVDVDAETLRRYRDDGHLAPLPLRVLPLSDGWRTAAGVLIAVGVVVAAGVLLAALRSSARPTRGHQRMRPDGPQPQDDGNAGWASSGSDAEISSASTASDASPSRTPSR